MNIPTGRRARGARIRTAVLPALLLTALLSVPLAAQDDQAWRVGFTLGGNSFVGLVVEYRQDAAAAELGVGTWSLRDLSLTLSGKYYAGRAAVSPYGGIGLWTLIALPNPREEETRSGAALSLRVPVGLDWGVAAHHAIGAEVVLNRALALRRPDPTDSTPPSGGIVPLPGFYYKVGRTP